MNRAFLAGAWASAVSLSLTAAAASFGPTPYLSAADSPFAGLPFGYFHLENFEDGALNTPGVTAPVSAVVLAPGDATDSVDGDDGAVDGLGRAGRSLYSASTLPSFAFEFSAAALGALPTHVGVVWTDVGVVTSGENFSGAVTAEAFDAASASIGVIGPVALGGDGSFLGETAEDRFLRFSHPQGIARLVISMANSVDWEVDHLQYGRLIPEPTAAGLLVTALACLAAAQRRPGRRGRCALPS